MKISRLLNSVTSNRAISRVRMALIMLPSSGLDLASNLNYWLKDFVKRTLRWSPEKTPLIYVLLIAETIFCMNVHKTWYSFTVHVDIRTHLSLNVLLHKIALLIFKLLAHKRLNIIVELTVILLHARKIRFCCPPGDRTFSPPHFFIKCMYVFKDSSTCTDQFSVDLYCKSTRFESSSRYLLS